MSEYYAFSGVPVTGSSGSSAVMRGEFTSVATGFAKLPALSGQGGTAVVVNPGGTALVNTTGTLALAGNFATTGAFSTTLAAQGSTTLTLPATSDTLVGRATTDTLTNKTLTAPVLGGTVTGTYTLGGTPTISGATLSGTTTLNGPVTATGVTVTGGTFSGATISSATITSATITTSTYNGNTFTTGTGTLTIAAAKTLTASNTLTLAGTDGKTLTVSNNLTLAGTDSTTMTFPSSSATIARTDAANTFTGIQTFSTPIAASSVAAMTATVGGGVPTPPNNTTTFLRGDGTFATLPAGGSVTSVSVVTANGVSGSVATNTTTPAITLTLGAITPTTVNGNTFTTGTFTLTGAALKTLTFNNSLTLAGTDSTTMTFPTTSATIARTDATNTFTGHQTIEGVTSTGATGTGLLVFGTSPTLTTAALGSSTASTQAADDNSTKVATTAFVIAQLAAVPRFIIHLNATQTITNNTFTKITYDTIDLDNKNWWDNTNHRYTPQVAGKYFIHITAQLGGSTALQYQLSINKNGSQVRNIVIGDLVVALPAGAGISVGAIIAFNGSTDFIEGAALINASGSWTVAGGAISTWIEGYYIST